MNRARLSVLVLLASPLAACAKESAPAPQQQASESAVASEAKPTPSASAAAMPGVALSAAAASSVAPVASTASSAAPGASTASSAAPTAAAAPTSSGAVAALGDAIRDKAAPASIAPGSSAAPKGSGAAIAPDKAADPGTGPIVLPTTMNGVLPAGAADKILRSGKPAIVHLLEAGAEPRADLGYAISKGPAPKLTMSMEMTLDLRSGAQKNQGKIPRIGMTLDSSATEQSPAGDWKVLATLAGISVGGGDDAGSDQMAAALRPQVAAMKGLGIGYWVNAKGRVRDVKVTLPKGFPAAAQSLVEGMNQSFESMVAPLPNEAVGIGAKWQVVSRMAASGADLLQSATYTLTSRDAAQATLDVTTVQLAASDAIRAPGSAAAPAAHVKSFVSGGTGTTRIDTTSVVPVRGTTTLKTTVTVGSDAGEGPAADSSAETLTTVQLSRP